MLPTFEFNLVKNIIKSVFKFKIIQLYNVHKSLTVNFKKHTYTKILFNINFSIKCVIKDFLSYLRNFLIVTILISKDSKINFKYETIKPRFNIVKLCKIYR